MLVCVREREEESTNFCMKNKRHQPVRARGSTSKEKGQAHYG